MLTPNLCDVDEIPNNVEPRRCTYCGETFRPRVKWQRVCSSYKCQERDDVVRVARRKFFTRVGRATGASEATILRVLQAQDGFCAWCRTPYPINVVTGIPRASWVALSKIRGVFVCKRCHDRVQRIEHFWNPKEEGRSFYEGIEHIKGFLDAVDAIWGDMRGSTRAAAETRRRAKLTARLEAIAGNADADGTGVGEIDS
jgi:hypothetical protein